jgi:hypothetical protein
MLYDVMQEYEVKIARLAESYRAGRALGMAARGLLTGPWRWRQSARVDKARRELLAERA